MRIIFGITLMIFSAAMGAAIAQEIAITEIPPAMTMSLLPDPDIGSADPTQQTPSAQNSQTQNSSPDASKGRVEIFSGTISKGISGYFLQVTASTSYRIDDESKVRDYEGKKVQITGTLEPDTNLIHVQSVKPA